MKHNLLRAVCLMIAGCPSVCSAEVVQDISALQRSSFGKILNTPVKISYAQETRFYYHPDVYAVENLGNGKAAVGNPRIRGTDGAGSTLGYSTKIVSYQSDRKIAYEDMQSSAVTVVSGVKGYLERYEPGVVVARDGSELRPVGRRVYAFDGDTARKLVEKTQDGVVTRTGSVKSGAQHLGAGCYYPAQVYQTPALENSSDFTSSTENNGCLRFVGSAAEYTVDPAAGYMLRAHTKRPETTKAVKATRYEGRVDFAGVALPTGITEEQYDKNGNLAYVVKIRDIRYEPIPESEANACFQFEFPPDTRIE